MSCTLDKPQSESTSCSHPPASSLTIFTGEGHCHPFYRERSKLDLLPVKVPYGFGNRRQTLGKSIRIKRQPTHSGTSPRFLDLACSQTASYSAVASLLGLQLFSHSFLSQVCRQHMSDKTRTMVTKENTFLKHKQSCFGGAISLSYRILGMCCVHRLQLVLVTKIYLVAFSIVTSRLVSHNRLTILQDNHHETA